LADHNQRLLKLQKSCNRRVFAGVARAPRPRVARKMRLPTIAPVAKKLKIAGDPTRAAGI